MTDLPAFTTLEDGYLHGTWFCGRPTAKYYGAFPKSFWPRARAILKPSEGEMLHWFSGTVPSEPGIVTVDGNPDVKPDLYWPGIKLPFADGQFHASFADPPYSPRDAKRYRLPYPPARSVLRELARVTRAGGRIGLLHEFLPVVKGSGAKLIGCIGILNGPQKRIRGFYVFEKLGMDSNGIRTDGDSVPERPDGDVPRSELRGGRAVAESCVAMGGAQSLEY